MRIRGHRERERTTGPLASSTLEVGQSHHWRDGAYIARGVGATLPWFVPWGKRTAAGSLVNDLGIIDPHRGRRWTVERTNSWLSNYGQLRRNTDRRPEHRLAQSALAVTLIITIKLIDYRNRWPPSLVRLCRSSARNSASERRWRAPDATGV